MPKAIALVALGTCLLAAIPSIATAAPGGGRLLALRPPPPPGAASAVPEAAWTAMAQQDVELVLVAGGLVFGKLVAHDAKTVTLVEPSGVVTVHAKAAVRQLRAAQAAAPPPAAVVSPSVPPPAVAAPASAVVSSTCAGGDCSLRAQGDVLHGADAAQRRAGKWTMVAGASAVGLGAILVGAGFGASRAAADEGYDPPGPDDFDTREAVAAHRTMIAGFVFLGVGALTTIAGGITYGVANQRIVRARRSERPVDVAIAPNGRGLSLAIGGRF